MRFEVRTVIRMDPAQESELPKGALAGRIQEYSPRSRCDAMKPVRASHIESHHRPGRNASSKRVAPSLSAAS